MYARFSLQRCSCSALGVRSRCGTCTSMAVTGLTESCLQVDTRKEIVSGSEQEVEIRACTVVAVEQLRDALVARYGASAAPDGRGCDSSAAPNGTGPQATGESRTQPGHVVKTRRFVKCRARMLSVSAPP